MISSSVNYRPGVRPGIAYAVLILLTVSAAVSVRAAGVTIITHGFQHNGDFPLWPETMAQDVGQVLLSQGITAELEQITVDGVFLPGCTISTWWTSNSPDMELVFHLDWSDVSHLKSDPDARAASESDSPPPTEGLHDGIPTGYAAQLVAECLMQSQGGRNLMELPLHLIGHSRGTSLISAVAEILAREGIWVDHQTTLDPQQMFYPYLDAQIEIHENVVFADNYWSAGDWYNLCPEGYDVPGTYSRELGDLPGGYGENDICALHGDVHLWYHATVDTVGEVIHGDGAVLSATDRGSWFAPAEGAGTTAGWHWSRLMGGNRLSPTINQGMISLLGGSASTRVAVSTADAEWPNLILLNVTGSVVLQAGATLAATYRSQDLDSGYTLRFWLDNNRNPWDGTNHQIHESSLGVSTGYNDLKGGGVNLSTAGVPPGNYYLCGEVNDSVRRRFLYAEPRITIHAGPSPSPTNTPPPGPTPTPTGTPGTGCGNFVGNGVTVGNTGPDRLNVRNCAGTVSCQVIGKRDDGDTGVVIGGPVVVDGYRWWQVDWDGYETTGWSAEGDGTDCWLTGSPPVTPTPSPACGPAGGIPLAIDNPAPNPADEFGGAVAIDGDTILIGGFLDDTGAGNTGSVYQFSAASGGLVRTLNNPDPGANDQFGRTVSVSGDAMAAGAPFDDTGAGNSGIVRVYSTTSGSLLHTIVNPAPTSNDNFGHAISMEGGRILIGAPFDDTGIFNAGSAYLFDVSGGSLLRTFNNPNPVASDQFGYSVALHGNRVLIGANRQDTGAAQAGIAYLIDATTGAVLQTLTNPSPGGDDEFGIAVALSDNRMLVGCAFDDSDGADAGIAYLFDVSTGALRYAFRNSSVLGNDHFGISVALSQDYAVIGAHRDQTGMEPLGTVHLFDVETGWLIGRIDNPLPAVNDLFGAGVALSGTRVLVGASGDDTVLTDAGSAYLFDSAAFFLCPTPSPPPTPEPTATPLAPTPTGAPCFPGDADNSCGFVDALDFIAVQANFGAAVSPGDPGDANCTGSFVDANDFIAVQANFGSQCL